MRPSKSFPVKNRLRSGLVFMLILLFLFIPSAELMLRTLCTYCTYTEQNQGRYVSPYAIQADSWYHIWTPNMEGRYQQEEFNYELRTNSLGIRDIEHDRHKLPGELRILAIGDSFTEGQGARFEQTWLNLLGASLRDRYEGADIRMLCGGVAGSDPFYGYRMLLDKLLHYQPDIVLLVVNHSDIMEVMVRGGMERFLEDGSVRGAGPPGSVSPMVVRWYESSHLVRFILFELFDYTHHLVTREERSRLAQEALEKIKALVREYHALLEGRGIGFSLVVLPFRGELKRNQYDMLDSLIESVSQHKIDVIDTRP